MTALSQIHRDYTPDNEMVRNTFAQSWADLSGGDRRPGRDAYRAGLAAFDRWYYQRMQGVRDAALIEAAAGIRPLNWTNEDGPSVHRHLVDQAIDVLLQQQAG